MPSGIRFAGGVNYRLSAQTSPKPKYLREDDKVFKKLLRDDTTSTGWLEFRRDVKIDATTFFSRFATNLGFGEHYTYRLLKDETDKQQRRHRRYMLYYKNIPVENADYALHSTGDSVYLAHGRIVENLSFDISKPIAEKKALEHALTSLKIDLNVFKGKLKEPAGTLVLTRTGEEAVNTSYQLAYWFDIEEGVEPTRVYVEATTGKVIKTVPLILHCFGGVHNHQVKGQVTNEPQPSGQTLTPAFVASNFLPNRPRYGTTVRPIETTEVNRNGENVQLLAVPNTRLETRITTAADRVGAAWNNANEVTNTTTNWGANSQNATTAHWLTERVHAFWLQPFFERNGLDGNGLRMPVVVNQRAIDAWSGPIAGNEQITFGFGPRADLARDFNGDLIPDLDRSLVTPDIVGHEYMHAIIRRIVPGGDPSGLTYARESGALNESIADIFGAALERFIFPDANQVNPQNWNWRLAEDVGYVFRDMQNPQMTWDPNPRPGEFPRQPARYQDANWFTRESCNDPFRPNDFCGVHTNSGIMNKWFHTVCTGQVTPQNNPPTVTPINFDHALRIVYKALLDYSSSGMTHVDMRNATIWASRDLYGGCSPEEKAVVASWGAAGINISGQTPCNVNCIEEPPVLVSAPANPACGQTVSFVLRSTYQGAFGRPNPVYRIRDLDGNVLAVTYQYGQTQDATINLTLPSSGAAFNMILGIEPRLTTANFCYEQQRTFAVSVNCGNPCDFSSGPRRIGTFNGQVVQIREFPNGKRAMIIRATNYPDKYYPVGDNFWEEQGNFQKDFGIDSFRGCLNAGTTGQNGLGFPTGLIPPTYYTSNTEPNGRVFFTDEPGACHIVLNPVTSEGSVNRSCGQAVTLNANCSGADCGGVSYSWSGNGISGSGSTVSFNVPGSNGSYTYSVTTSKAGCPNQTGTITLNVTGCSGPCNFAVSPSPSDGNINRSCGQAVTLNANCNGGDCAGVNYSWSGNGISGSGSSLNINVPNANGSYAYLVTASKAGCTDKTNTVTINVSGCPGGGLTTNACYNIKVEKAGKRLQAMGDNTILQLASNGANDQIWRVDDRGNGRVSFTTQDGTNRAIQVNNGGAEGVWLTLSGYAANGVHDWRTQSSPSDANLWRVFYPANNNTWDLEGYGTGANLQIYGNTSESFFDYRSFRFEAASCPTGGNSCNFTPTASIAGGNPNVGCSQGVTLNATCNGGDCGGVSYSWSGNGLSGGGSSVGLNVPGTNGSYTYMLTASKGGCANQTSNVTLNVSGCGGGTTTCIEVESGTGNRDVQNNPAASGGQFVSGFGVAAEYLQYPINVPAAGNYTVQFTYAAGGSTGSFGVVVNGGGVQNVSLPGSGGWGTFQTRSATLSLPAGSSTLRIQGNGGSIALDKFCIQSGARLGVSEASASAEGLQLRVSPNPNSGQFRVQFQTRAGEWARLRLVDVSGRAVRAEQRIRGTGGVHEEAIILPASVRGVLLLEVVSGSERASQRVLIE